MKLSKFDIKIPFTYYIYKKRILTFTISVKSIHDRKKSIFYFLFNNFARKMIRHSTHFFMQWLSSKNSFIMHVYLLVCIKLMFEYAKEECILLLLLCEYTNGKGKKWKFFFHCSSLMLC